MFCFAFVPKPFAGPRFLCSCLQVCGSGPKPNPQSPSRWCSARGQNYLPRLPFRWSTAQGGRVGDRCPCVLRPPPSVPEWMRSSVCPYPASFCVHVDQCSLFCICPFPQPNPGFKKKQANTTHGRKYVGNHHAVTNLLFFMRVHIVIIKNKDRQRWEQNSRHVFEITKETIFRHLRGKW